jgi:hypothetical protein
MTDVLASRTPQQVADWYHRLAGLIDQKKVNGERPLASRMLQAWLDNAKNYATTGTAIKDNVVFQAPTHLKTSKYVVEVLEYHRAVFLTEQKTKKDKWGGILPRLQGKSGFTAWDGTGTLDLEYQSLTEVPVWAQVSGTDGDKDLLYALHGFQLRSKATVQLAAVGPNAKRKVTFTAYVAEAEDIYDWDPTKHISVPNPDYGSTAPDAVEPSSDTITVYHTNAKRVEAAQLAKPYNFFASWTVTIASVIGEGEIDPNKSLGLW